MLINIFKLIRLHNLIISCLAIAVAYYLLDHSLYHPNFFITTFNVFIFMAFGNCINDIKDINNDKIAHPYRVLIQKQISKELAGVICVCLFILGIFATFFIPIEAKYFLYCLIIPLLILYSIALKGIPLIGNIIVAFLLSSVFIFSELIINGTYFKLIVPISLVFGFSLIREILKDLHDYDGDKKLKIKTLVVVVGVQKARAFVLVLIICFIILSLVPYFLINEYNNLKYLLSIIILIEIPLIIILFLLINKSNKTIFKQLSKATKILSVFGLFVFIVTKN